VSSDVEQWLEGLGLGRYAAVFAENEIDLDALPHITEDDLKDVGVALGPRRKLLAAIAELDSRGPPAPESATLGDRSAGVEAERRQLTVMFCDLVGSTELSRRLDPEDLREVMRRYQDAAAGAITRYEGYVAKFLGDGVLAYFGWPQAHEDQAERAVRAGLDAAAAVARLKLDDNVALQARAGIATGQVVVGDMVGEAAAEAEAVAGETPNLAARLQGIAAPGQVVIGPLTRELIGETFDLANLGAHELKGFAEPVQVWRVVREGDIDSRYEAKHVGGVLPLVGRQEELGLLLRSWEASKEAHGQVVLIQGEAGIGKSRLVEALREQVSGEDYIWIANRFSPYHANSTLYPVIEHLKRALGWKPEDGAEERLEKLEAALKGQSLPPEEAVPLYADLMSLTLPEGRYAPLELNAKQKREQTLDALSGWLLEEAERTPVLQVWEDLHWADPTTLELLALFIEQSPTVSMLNVLTYRPEFVPPWTMHSHMTPITLNRLERPEVEALIGHQAAGKAVPLEVIEHIVGKSDGVPLYVEELTKTILESDYLHEEADRYTLDGSLSEVAIPATLQDSLMARLDRLPRVREVAQLGAVLGREFAYQMLQYLAPLEEPVLLNGLGQLVENELLYQRGRPPRSRYIFKHALIQDAAYQSLLKRTRQQYHRQVAALMEERFPETVEAHPELVAHHFAEAGCTEEAVAYLQEAGQIALGRSANVEAVTHFERGLELLPQLPETAKRHERELDIQMALGPALVATRGYADAGVGRVYERAWQLCQRLEDSVHLPLVLRGQQVFRLLHGELNKAQEFAKQFLDLAAGADPVLPR
jgi:class 3 adenylate cyclase